MILDDWQEKILKTEGNIVLRSGRQVGKSTIIARKAVNYALKNKKSVVIIGAAVERQAIHIFFMIRNYLTEEKPQNIKGNPTLQYLELTNGSIIRCLPIGDSGRGLRGYTADMLIIDEAAFVSKAAWEAITPLLATTQGPFILLSTPFGREGYFYDCWKDPDFESFHISSEDCPRITKEYLDREKRRMSKRQYAQEYLGEFVDELRQFFPDKLIRDCMILKKRTNIIKGRKYYLGVDIARMGEDESTFEIIEKLDNKNMHQIENLVTKHTLTTATTQLILTLEDKYNFKRIFVDDGGMGVGVFDQLLTDEKTRRKVIAINNESRPLTRDEKKMKRSMKEDLYNNLLALMERGEIKLLDDDEIFLSLKSVQYEYLEKGKMRIFGNYTHIAEGLIRAAWGSKDKSLNIWVRSF